jgi:hypothetical protein
MSLICLLDDFAEMAEANESRTPNSYFESVSY